MSQTPSAARARQRPRLLLFLLVGGGFATGYSALTAILIGTAGLPSFATSVGLYMLCVPLAFLAQRQFTFAARETGWRGFPVYAATQVGSLALVAAISTRFVTQVVYLDFLIFLVTAGSAALVSFLVCSLLAFRPRE